MVAVVMPSSEVGPRNSRDDDLDLEEEGLRPPKVTVRPRRERPIECIRIGQGRFIAVKDIVQDSFFFFFSFFGGSYL